MVSRAAPKPPSEHSHDHPRSPLLTWIKHKLSASWHHRQIAHRSEYSIERLLAFHDYYESTSPSRVFAVCFFTPIPALLAALALDCIPLRHPSEGWRANYTVWIRLLLAMTIEALGVAFSMRAVTESDTISIGGAIKISITTAISSVLTLVMLAAVWRFPTPFGYVFAIGPFVLFFSLSTILLVGPRVLIQSPTLRQQFKSQFTIIASQGLVAGCYPIFSAVFNRLSGVQQTAFIFAMPLIKFLTKQNIANAAKSYHEYVGPVVVFSVDLFNVYYVAICMQASKSIVTTLIIMAADAFHVILALRAIFHHEKGVQESQGPVIWQPRHHLRDMPAVLRTLCQEEKPSDAYNWSVRLLAPFPLPLSNDSRTLIHELATAGNFANVKAIDRRCSIKSAIRRSSGDLSIGPLHSKKAMPTVAALKLNQIAPAAPAAWGHTRTHLLSPSRTREPPDGKVLSTKRIEDLRNELQTLFHSEYILLAEYLEFTVPMLYALYLAVLFHLPVAAYYPHTASMTAYKLQQTMTNILIYATIEFVAFGGLFALLKRRFGFSPLYQLAFVLETHAPALQSHLFVWTITILHLTLAHYGVDFNILAS